MEFVIIFLVALLVSVMIFSIKTLKRLSGYQDIVENLPDPVMRVASDSFEPILCNYAFSDLLGYANPEECVQEFNHHPHLPQQNFYQIWHQYTEAMPQTVRVQLQDQLGNVAARALHVQMANRGRFMDLVATPTISDLSDQLRTQNVVCYLELDDELIVKDCNPLAADTFRNIDFGVSRLPDFAFPENQKTRLLNIYKKRLERHGSLRISHQTILNGVDKSGKWALCHVADNTYHAIFQLQSELVSSQAALFDFLEEGIGFWEFDIERQTITHNRQWLMHLNYDSLSETMPLSSWLGLMLPEDRPLVQTALENAKSFPISYRMASGKGVSLKIETRGMVKEFDKDGGIKTLQGFHINHSGRHGKTAFNKNEFIKTIASNLGYELEDASTPQHVDLSLVEGIMSSVGDFLITEYGKQVTKRIEIPVEEKMRCSSCFDNNENLTTFTISCPNVSVPRQILGHILEPGFSTQRIHPVDSINLARINKRIHDVGGHLELSTGGNSGFIFHVHLPPEKTETTDVVLVENEGSGPIAKDLVDAGYSVAVTTKNELWERFKDDPTRYKLVISEVSNRHVFSLLELQSDLPIIVYGSLSDKVNANEVLDAGAKAYLEAPIDMRHLVHLVEREIAEVSGAAGFV